MISLFAAQELADRMLTVLAQRPDDIEAFFVRAGAAPDDLRDMARRPEFRVFLIDFVMESDERVIGFADALNCSPKLLAEANAVLTEFNE